MARTSQLSEWRGTNLADDGVVGGGDGVEDPFDALQLLLVACGDPVKRLVVVLKSTATFTAGNRKSVFIVLWKPTGFGGAAAYMSTGSATSMYLIFISLGKSISSFTSHSLLTSTDESLGFS